MGGSSLPPTSAVVSALRCFLWRLPVTVVAAVVYGSVAKGRHQAGSDVDALLVTDRHPSDNTRADAGRQYKAFELSLGFECRQALGLTMATGAGTGVATPTSPGLTAEDIWEVVYALVTPHEVVTGESLVDELRTAAEARLAQLRAWMTRVELDVG